MPKKSVKKGEEFLLKQGMLNSEIHYSRTGGTIVGASEVEFCQLEQVEFCQFERSRELIVQLV